MSDIKVRERPKAPPQGTDGPRRIVDVAAGVVLEDPGTHARWAWCDPESKRSKTRIENLKRQGYRPATEQDVADLRDAYTQPDGTIHRGDQMLMVCDRSAVEARDAAAHRERESVERKQVKTIESGQGIETDEELHRQRARGKEVDLV